jgi:transcriptional regulator with XRE-family HTH domain
LRIAEACNIQYSELFEDADTGSTGLSKNAYFPDVVYKRIYKMIQKNYKSFTAFAKLIGVHFSTVSLWMNGKTHPTPIAFQNTLTVLKLKSYDLEAMVESTREKKKPVEKAVSVEPKKEEVVVADDFESKVVKIMRLQKELPELIEQVNVLYGKIYTLKEKLLELS